MVEYFLDQTGTVEVTNIEDSEYVRVLDDGTVLVPPPGEVSPAIIDLAILNPRDFSVGLEYPDAAGGAGFSVKQSGSGRIRITISGAKERETYAFPLIMKSPDGLREFPAVSLKLQCVSFNTAIRELTVNGASPPDFSPYRNTCAVVLPHETSNITVSGTTVHTEANLALANSENNLSDSGTHTVTSSIPAPPPGSSYQVIFTVTAPNTDTDNYAVTVYRRTNDSRNIAAFTVTSPVKVSGIIDESLHTITLPVPAGIDISNMTASVLHTGASVSPASGTARDFRTPQTYTVTAVNGQTQSYTVTAITGSGLVISGFIVDDAIHFTGVPALVAPGGPITISISGRTVASWAVYFDGTPASPAASTPAAVTVNAPSVPGFRTVNVIAEIDGIPYSGAFPLTVE
jgi:hypothetical protein